MNAAPDNWYDALESLLVPCTYAEVKWLIDHHPRFRAYRRVA